VPLVGTITWSEKCIEWTTLCPVFKKSVKKKSAEQLLLQGLESILVAWIQKTITGTLSSIGQPHFSRNIKKGVHK
jgi:hypothetical protein